jgi:LacI family transcriptional regulator, gluconate utilization system Gnt-I transcriptional repressor
MIKAGADKKKRTVAKPARQPRNTQGRRSHLGQGKATIRDVSRLARVSRMTVSRFFSNPELLLPATRDQVAQAVKTLSYVPNRAAGSLSSRRSGFIALILPTLTNSNFAAVAHGLTDAVRPANYQLLIGYTEYEVGEEERQIELMLARRPEAIVITGEHHSRHCTGLLTNCGVPVVELADLPQRPIDMAVGFSNREVGRIAAAHLLSQGYRTIGAIGPGRSDDSIDFRGEDRLDGFEESLRSAGVRTDLVLRHGNPPFSYERGAEGLAMLLDREPAIDAIFAVSDLAAVGAMMECRRRGIDIPGRLAIIGFGDFDIAAQMVPPLTTIAVDFDNLGRQTGSLLLGVLRGEVREPARRVTEVGMHLIHRGTTETGVR